MITIWALAADVAQAQAPDPANAPQQSPAWDEAQAQAIDRSIMCPVCPAETIDQAQVPIARQMRQLVRQKLAAGESREQVLEFFAQRYGRDIVAFPPKSGFNLVAWLFPVVGIGALLVAGGLVLRSMAARRATEPPAPLLADAALEPYLSRVDQDLDRLQIGVSLDSDDSSVTPGSSPQDQREDGEEQHG
jgi:cytochrome c-type biogenesis protein CcmH